MKKLYIFFFCLLVIKPIYAQTAKEWFDKGEKAEDYNKAIEYFTKAIEKGYKPLADAYLYRGATWYLTRKNYQKAINDFNKVIQLQPNYVEAYVARGRANEMLDNHEEAIKDFSKVIKLNPKIAIAYYELAHIKEDLGFYEEAINYYDKFLLLEPNDDDAYDERAWLKAELGYYEEAIKDYNKAIQIKPISYYYEARGDIEYKIMRYKAAIIDYKKALELMDNNTWGTADLQQRIALAETALAEQNANSNPNVIGNTLTQFQIKKTNIIVVQYISLLIEHGRNPNSSIEASKEILRLFDSRENLVYNDIATTDENIEIYAYLSKVALGEEKIKFDFAEKSGKFDVVFYKNQYTAVNLTKTIKGNGINRTVRIKVIVNPAKGKIVNIIKN